MLTIVLKHSHHSREPVKTPKTNKNADDTFSPDAPAPRPAKTAAKDRIVIGLVSVSSKVEVYAPASPLLFAVAAVLAGGAMAVL